MRGGMVRIAVLASVLLMVVPAFGHGQISSASAVSWPAIHSNVVMIVQGQNTIIAGEETNRDFYALKIISYELPHDVSRVYASVPDDARNLTVWTQSGPLNETQFGRETGGNMSGQLFIDVPASHRRSSVFQNTTGNESAFSAPGSVSWNCSYSSGALRQASGSDSGYFISADIGISAAYDITSGNLSFSGSSLENVTSALSNDGGITWIPCPNATAFDFGSHGAVLKVRFVFDGNSTLGFQPTISSFTITADYVLKETIFSTHISYEWTEEFTSRLASINLSEATPYTSAGSFLVMFYSAKGYVPSGNGFEFTFDSDGSMSTLPDKNLYLYSAPLVVGDVNITMNVTAPKPSSSWLLYVAIAIAAVFVAGGLMYGIPSRRRNEAESTDESIVGSAVPRDEDKEARRRDLVARKKELLTEIEMIKQDKGESSDGKQKFASLKLELKQVRNELNKLPRASPDMEPGSGGPPEGPYDAVLASLARLDDDFEKGRLPESSYKSLRKEYVSKAAALMAAKKAPVADDPLSSEKTKLMEALVALDEEHDRGEVGDDVYKELRASYRKELAGVMRKIDEARKEE